MSADIQELNRRYRALLQDRAPWENAWRDLARHFLPTRYRSTNGSYEEYNAPLLNTSLVDASGVLALRTLAAGMQGGMTSPARPWFRLALSDPALHQSREARHWLDQVSERMRTVFQRSNFYNAVHTLYGELATFGTAFLFELADMEHGFRFLPLTAGEYTLDCDARYRVDTVFRRFFMSASQLHQRFGEENLPASVARTAKEHPEQRFPVLHGIFPRGKYNVSSHNNMPFSSVYWLEGANDLQRPLHISGFMEFPAYAPRWDITSTNIYGHSPAMDALPDCRMLQQMGITTLKAIHKAVDPPMSVAASLKSVGLDLTPGGVNYIETASGQNPQAAVPLLQLNPDIGQARKAMQEVQNQIRAGLYNDLFRLIMDGRSQVTAKEIAVKEEEKLILIGPVLERLHDELFIPLIDRTFMLMQRMDMLPPCPEALKGHPLKIEFVSLLAQAQKLVSTGAISQYISFAATTGQLWPEALDTVDVDAVMDGYADYLGVEVGMLRPQEERNDLRTQRQNAQSLQSLQQNLDQCSTLAKTLGETRIHKDGTSALEFLANAFTSQYQEAPPPPEQPLPQQSSSDNTSPHEQQTYQRKQ